jgi:hypothetical protein
MASRGYGPPAEELQNVNRFVERQEQTRTIAIAALVFAVVAFVAGAIALGFGSSYINTHFYSPSPAPVPPPPPIVSTSVTYIQPEISAIGNITLIVTSFGSARVVSLLGYLNFTFFPEIIYFPGPVLAPADLPIVDPVLGISTYPVCAITQSQALEQSYLFYLYFDSEGRAFMTSAVVNAINYGIPSPPANGLITGISANGYGVDPFFFNGNGAYPFFIAENPWYLECHVSWQTAAALGVASASVGSSSAHGGWPFNRTRGGK